MIGWSAAGFVAINVVAVKLFDWQPARRTHTHTPANGLITYPRDLLTA